MTSKDQDSAKNIKISADRMKNHGKMGVQAVSQSINGKKIIWMSSKKEKRKIFWVKKYFSTNKKYNIKIPIPIFKRKVITKFFFEKIVFSF